MARASVAAERITSPHTVRHRSAASLLVQGRTSAQITAVLPANIQRSGCSVSCIVQLGYAVCTAPSGTCNGIPNDGLPHFVWTCADNNSLACLADSWFGKAPIIGHRYAFQIVYQSYNWKFLLRDISAGGATISKLLTVVHWYLGDGVWWGSENWDANSTLGPTAVGGSIYDTPLEYLRVSTPWTIAHPVGVILEAWDETATPYQSRGPITSRPSQSRATTRTIHSMSGPWPTRRRR